MRCAVDDVMRGSDWGSGGGGRLGDKAEKGKSEGKGTPWRSTVGRNNIMVTGERWYEEIV